MTVKTTCPECGERHWFAPIGRLGTYSCNGCGNIERDLGCVECGCSRFFTSMPFGTVNRCRACGCTKEPEFGVA